MRNLTTILLAVSLPGFALGGVGPAPAAPVPGAVQRLVDAADGAAEVRIHRATGQARFVRIEPGAIEPAGADAATRAWAFLAAHGEVFGIVDAATELSAPEVRVDSLGATRVTYVQVFRGLPVFAGMLHAHFDPAGRLIAVNGTFVPGIDVPTRPARSEADAVATATAHALARTPGLPAAPVEARSTRLLVYRTGLVQRVAGRDRLAWEVEVGNGVDVRETVYVDALHGKVLDSFSGIHDAIDRETHEGQLNDIILWQEGDALPYTGGSGSDNDQVNGLIAYAEDVYDLFQVLSAGGFPSWDGLDGTLFSVYKTASMSCPNASWNGTSTNYCDGVTSDDVVAHEWVHAYTERTHGLVYAWQSGALNESYSDIFGEVIDFINGDGTDSPAPLRAADDCSTFGGNPPPGLEVLAPAAAAGDYAAAGANFNPPPPLAATAEVELVDDGAGQGSDLCDPAIGFTPGRIAMIDRGGCNFSGKVKRAQDAGAVGAIVVNYNDNAFNMGGNDPSITIPAVMVASSVGQILADELGNGLAVTLEIAGANDPSLRWLTGEDSFGFGGAIRDLWNPACFGDPPKVTAGQYFCGNGDSGGVHTNSGVPNHAFALIVDGGVYDGHTISGIGLMKAAHLYWRAMSVYQVFDSGFADHADALEQSCADLLGVELADLTTGAPSGQSLSAADCAEVSEALLAVEMSEDPPCNFQPLLDPNAPPLGCGAVAFADDFESDPTGSWSLSNYGVFEEYEPRDWEWTADVPEGGSGSAFFALDSLAIGNCEAGVDDQSGVMTLESPVVTLGGQAVMAFDHWVATEPNYDGGNLSISVNGGTYQPIPGSDFIFNPYNVTLETAENENTNPLAGQEAFSGSDGGQIGGSWGRSQIDLGAYAGAGDTIRVRFDFGVDGCNGLVGWYVDDVLVCTSENGAGSVPDGAGVPGSPLTVDRSGADVTLSWGASCVTGDSDYAIYEGAVGDFTGHVPVVCTTGGATTETFTPGGGDVYYLVVPLSPDREGSYGVDSEGTARPPSGSACLPQALAPGCG